MIYNNFIDSLAVGNGAFFSDLDLISNLTPSPTAEEFFMKYIKLTKDKFAIVNDEDYEKVNQHKWCYDCLDYAVRNKGQSKKQRMQNFILNPPIGFIIDHINGNGLDNRRNNLRIATQSQNRANSIINKNNTSGHRGVYWYKPYNKWMVMIMVNYKQIFLGYHIDKLKAVRIYNKSAIKYFGEFAKLNNI